MHGLAVKEKRLIKQIKLNILTSKVFLPVISNSFGKNAVNCIHFELIPRKIKLLNVHRKDGKK